MREIQIVNQVVSLDDQSINTTLKNAYETKQRPLCLCKASGVPMYIARVSDKYVVKRMPNSGQSHHPDCESFELPPELSGRSVLNDGAISEDSTTGLTALKFGFSLSKNGASRAAPVKSDEKKTTVEADPKKLTLLSLLHCLYDDAGFNKWSPAMSGKRSWGVIQRYLVAAAQNKIVRGSPLSEILLIPEKFAMDKKDLLASKRRKFLANLLPSGKKSPVGICIGELKAIEKSRFNYKLIIKHMGDMPLYLDDDMETKIQKNFARELALHQEDEAVHLLVVATFVVSASGNPTVDVLSFMTVDKQWLPFESLEERDVINLAIGDKRHFIKGMRYNLRPLKVIASLLFTDVGEEPATFYIVPSGAGESYYEDLEHVTSESVFESFIYDVNKDESICLPVANATRAIKKRTQPKTNSAPGNKPPRRPYEQTIGLSPPTYLNDVPPIDDQDYVPVPSSSESATRPALPTSMFSDARQAPLQSVHSKTVAIESLATKTHFGRYEIIRPLGRGAMGEVYLCKDPLISRQLAIKSMEYKRFDASEIQRNKTRFLKEAEAAGKLNHEGIVSVFDMGEDEECAYIAMDYILGSPLDKHVKPPNLLESDVVAKISNQVAVALDYAHSNGVIHRDIKPANIMYNNEPFAVKIADFGVAKLTNNSQTRAGSLIGSPLYMSPEQIKGESITFASDIFSLGVTMYELLTGELPFNIENFASLTYAIINTDPIPIRNQNADVPSELGVIVHRALMKDSNDRYPSAQSMAIDLRKAIAQPEPQ